MLEKPGIQDDRIISCLYEEHGVEARQIAFLPLGADRNTAVYRAVADDGVAYFVKLRQGPFDELSVALPKFLSDQGIAQIIAPLPARSGQLWTGLDPFKLILYPFIEGRDGYQVALSDDRWREFGAVLKRIHTASAPTALTRLIQRETYSPRWRQVVMTFLGRIETDSFIDPLMAGAAAFLNANRRQVLDLVARADRLAQALQARPPEFTLCHSDLHAGNLLITAHGAFYIVDWDAPILAPKERDLMFIGGAQGFLGRTAQEEVEIFYQGYGPAQIDPVPLAYYRYERIVEDIAVECEEIFSTSAGDQDRELELGYMKSNFKPGNVIEVSYRSDGTGWWG